MSNEPVKLDLDPQGAVTGAIMEQVLIKGDLSKLTERERIQYYNTTCQSLGLNPLTQPFAYIVLNGKLQLYAKRDCCDQLRRIQGISITKLEHEWLSDELYCVRAYAKSADGRQDEDSGAVFIPEKAAGEVRANLMLKCITKAKRRVTLSICGLGWLDETEVEDIPQESKEPPRQITGQTSKEQADMYCAALTAAKSEIQAFNYKENLKKYKRLASLDKADLTRVMDCYREVVVQFRKQENGNEPKTDNGPTQGA